MEPIPWRLKLAIVAIGILILRLAMRIADGIVR